MNKVTTIGVVLVALAIILLATMKKPTSTNNQQNSSLSSIQKPPTKKTDVTNTPPNPDSTPQTTKLPKPKLEIDQEASYTATITTTKGDIVIELDVTNTPITANNFIYLANNNFYNNTIFHRTIQGFMIQGGDPTGTGTGGPGYSISDELGSFNKNNKWTISMANSGPNTGGSQFFINLKDNNDLDPKHPVFGRVVKGQDVVDAIAAAPTTSNPSGESSKPLNPVIIKKVTINSN